MTYKFEPYSYFGVFFFVHSQLLQDLLKTITNINSSICLVILHLRIKEESTYD